MKAGRCERINWDELLERIEDKNIIPVLGQGLYRVITEGNKSGVLLYEYLAEKLARECGFALDPAMNHKFSKAALHFLGKNKPDYSVLKKLRRFLLDRLKEIKLSPDQQNPLWKLARIKPFQLFINTAYDDYLVNTLGCTRNYQTRALSYTRTGKKLDLLNDDLFDDVENSRCTLVYNIYGNLRERIDPAFTEKDILETIVSFREQVGANPDNRLGEKLKESSLLFMGCGYDDWLFRFFIRTVANRPYRYPAAAETLAWKYVADGFENNQKDPFEELPRFLINYDSDVCYAGSGAEFVKTLFEKLEQEFPHTIIPTTDFPETAFISFHGANRATAFQLASQLQKDGIKVWVDHREFKPGDKVDATIINAMKKCPVFIPLVSRESQNLFLENGDMKYHCQEWNRVWLFNHENEEEGHPPKTVIPVVIDDTPWMYERFKDLDYVKIPGGGGGEYGALKTRLLEFQLPGVT